jgi:hypothetical protein
MNVEKAEIVVFLMKIIEEHERVIDKLLNRLEIVLAEKEEMNAQTQAY